MLRAALSKAVSETKIHLKLQMTTEEKAWTSIVGALKALPVQLYIFRKDCTILMSWDDNNHTSEMLLRQRTVPWNTSFVQITRTVKSYWTPISNQFGKRRKSGLSTFMESWTSWSCVDYKVSCLFQYMLLTSKRCFSLCCRVDCFITAVGLIHILLTSKRIIVSQIMCRDRRRWSWSFVKKCVDAFHRSMF